MIAVDESTFEIFAPNKDAMEEAREFIDKVRTVQVIQLIVFSPHIPVKNCKTQGA